MKDSWCGKTTSKNGTPVSGGAARNVRIAAFNGGMDEILTGAAAWGFNQAAKAMKRR